MWREKEYGCGRKEMSERGEKKRKERGEEDWGRG